MPPFWTHARRATAGARPSCGRMRTSLRRSRRTVRGTYTCVYAAEGVGCWCLACGQAAVECAQISRTSAVVLAVACVSGGCHVTLWVGRWRIPRSKMLPADVHMFKDEQSNGLGRPCVCPWSNGPERPCGCPCSNSHSASPFLRPPSSSPSWHLPSPLPPGPALHPHRQALTLHLPLLACPLPASPLKPQQHQLLPHPALKP
eukprot:207115-Chlamydomonas_euryale.AAC.1